MKRVLLTRVKLDRITKRAEELRKEYSLKFDLSFDLTGASAGQVKISNLTSKTSRLRLNLAFIEDNYEEMIEQTLPHEIAHLMAWDKYGRAAKGHGGAWQEMMAKLGVTPDRTHKMSVKAVYKKTLVCDCQTHHVSTRMYNSVARGAKRRCKSCSTEVRLGA